MKTILKPLVIILLITAVSNIANAAISLAFSHKDASFCDYYSGVASVNPSNGTPPYSYLWSTGANTQTITGLFTGTYTVTVTDFLGATASGSVVVDFFWPDNPPEFIGPTSECSQTPYTYTVTNTSLFPANTIYNWYKNGIYQGSGSSYTFTVPPIANDQIYVEAFDNLCTLPSITIVIQKCCHDSSYIEWNDDNVCNFFNTYGFLCPTVVYDGLVSYNGQPAHPNILINGTFLWDSPTQHTFINCNFLFGDGARILNTTGSSMSFTNCNFKSCSFLWQGIEMKVPGQIQMRNCRVNDAYYAIWQRKPCSMNLNDVTFDNNYIGVKYGFFGYYPFTGFPIVSTIPGVYNRVNFNSNNALKGAYPGLIADPTLPGTHGYAGVYAQFVSNLEFFNNVIFGDPTGTGNNHLNIGIYCSTGGLNVHPDNPSAGVYTGVYFGNILAEPFYGNLPPNGCAIYASGDPREVGGKLTVIGLISVPLGPTSFKNCGYGVYSTLMVDNLIADNYMDDVNRAIYVNRGYGQIGVNGNILYANRRAIELAYNAPTTLPPAPGIPAINVVDNQITIGPNPAEASPFGVGVYMYEAPGNTDPTDGYMFLNQVAVTEGRYGFHFLNVHNSFQTVCNSWLAYNDRQFGTKVEICRDITWQCSGHQTPVALYTASQPEHYGSFVRGSRDCVWDCNYFGYNYRDMHWQGNCSSSDIRGNWMDDASDCGYYLTTNAVTGIQLTNGTDPNGNIWKDPDQAAGFFPPQRAAVNNNTANFLASEVDVDPFNIIGFPPNYYWYPNYNSPNNTTPPQGQWFFDLIGPTYECGSLCWAVSPHDEDFSVDTLIASDSTLTSEYVPESKKIMQQNLFEKLKADPALLGSSTLFQQFYSTKVNTNMNLFAEVKEDINNNLKPSSSEQQQLDDVSGEIDTRLQLLHYRDSLLQSGSLAIPDSLSLESLNLITRSELDSLFKILSGLKQTINDNTNIAADDIKDDVDAITDNDQIEYNHKMVYQIYLSTIARGIFQFTSQQEADLLDIASQCPDAGGEGVIDARILYDLVDPEMDYDDNAICAPYGYFRSAQSSNDVKAAGQNSVIVFSIYPNPAKEKVRVSYNLTEPAELIFYTATGQKAFTQKLEYGSHIKEINTSSFNGGAYSWKLQTGSVTKNGTLFIIK